VNLTRSAGLEAAMKKLLWTSICAAGVAAAAPTLAQQSAASPPDAPRTASIQDAAWLAGRWVGTGLGGELEEVWSRPAGGQMVGHFRLLREGKPVFYEFILLDVTDGGIRMRLKHFNPDHTAWEEKDTWTTFAPVSSRPTELVFNGLTIQLKGTDAMTMKLSLRNGEAVTEETLQFRRADPR
jgi:hypothetical protein